MEVEAIENVVTIWEDEYQKLRTIDYINSLQIFENKGTIMGCSNPHPHGQIWAQSSVPQEVEKKTREQKNIGIRKVVAFCRTILFKKLVLTSA